MDQSSRAIIKIVHNDASLYDVLKLEKNSTIAEIDEAYAKQLALHRSLVADSSREKASRVSKNFLMLRKDALDIAYGILRDPPTRSAYDVQMVKGFSSASEEAPVINPSNIVGQEIVFNEIPSHRVDESVVSEDGNSVFDFDDDTNRDDKTSESKEQTAVAVAPPKSSQSRPREFKWLESLKSKRKDKKVPPVALPSGDADKRTPTLVTPTKSDLDKNAIIQQNNSTDYEEFKHVKPSVTPTSSPKSTSSSDTSNNDADEESNNKSATSHLSGIPSSLLDKAIDESVEYVVFKNRVDTNFARCGHVVSKPKMNSRIQKKRVSKRSRARGRGSSMTEDSASDDSETKFTEYSDEGSTMSSLDSVAANDFCFSLFDAQDACDTIFSSIVELPSTISELCGVQADPNGGKKT